MKRYLIDTNVISELRKKERCDPNVRQWFETVDDSEIFLSVLVIGELRSGIERIRRRDPQAAFYLNHWLQEVIDNHSDSLAKKRSNQSNTYNILSTRILAIEF